MSNGQRQRQIGRAHSACSRAVMTVVALVMARCRAMMTVVAPVMAARRTGVA
jgi:hypothetical protein